MFHPKCFKTSSANPRSTPEDLSIEFSSAEGAAEKPGGFAKGVLQDGSVRFIHFVFVDEHPPKCLLYFLWMQKKNVPERNDPFSPKMSVWTSKKDIKRSYPNHATLFFLIFELEKVDVQPFSPGPAALAAGRLGGAPPAVGPAVAAPRALSRAGLATEAAFGWDFFDEKNAPIGWNSWWKNPTKFVGRSENWSLMFDFWVLIWFLFRVILSVELCPRVNKKL